MLLFRGHRQQHQSLQERKSQAAGTGTAKEIERRGAHHAAFRDVKRGLIQDISFWGRMEMSKNAAPPIPKIK